MWRRRLRWGWRLRCRPTHCRQRDSGCSVRSSSGALSMMRSSSAFRRPSSSRARCWRTASTIRASSKRASAQSAFSDSTQGRSARSATVRSSCHCMGYPTRSGRVWGCSCTVRSLGVTTRLVATRRTFLQRSCSRRSGRSPSTCSILLASEAVRCPYSLMRATATHASFETDYGARAEVRGRHLLENFCMETRYRSGNPQASRSQRTGAQAR